MTMDRKHLRTLNFTTWIVIGASFLALFLMGPVVYSISFGEFVRRIVISLYQPNVNICGTGMFDRLYFNQVVYGLFVYSAVMIICWMRFRKKLPWRDICGPVLQRTAVITFVMFTLLQTSGMTAHWWVKSKVYRFAHQTAKQQYWYGDIALFAGKVRNVLPGKHNAQLITDLDFRNDPHAMFEQRKLAYFFYPIDIRNVRLGDKDVIVVFDKKNPEQYVSADYEIVIRQGNDSLVAVKK
jgi:hypothetical protein